LNAESDRKAGKTSASKIVFNACTSFAPVLSARKSQEYYITNLVKKES
jgi:hypothetical protein